MTSQTSDIVVRRDVPGQIVLERRLLTGGRALLAAILLGLAYVPLNWAVRAGRYFTAAASPEEWRQAYPGFALLSLAGLVPVAFAWVLLLRRRSVVLDLTQRYLTAVRDDRVYTVRRRHAFADVARVVVSRRQTRKPPVTFPVTLVMRDGSEEVVSDAPGKAQARGTAHLVAEVVGVEVEAEA